MLQSRETQGRGPCGAFIWAMAGAQKPYGDLPTPKREVHGFCDCGVHLARLDHRGESQLPPVCAPGRGPRIQAVCCFALGLK